MKPYFAMPEDGWYNIAIAGEFPHATGYVQVLDSEAFKAIVQDVHEQMGKPNWPGILIDFDHGSLDTAKPSTAAGWLTDIEERPDGLWARIRWSDCGQKSLEGGEFRFVSPVWMLADCEELGEKRVRPKKIASCAITNAPNIRGMVPLTNRTEEKGVSLSPTGRALPIQERVQVPRAALALMNTFVSDAQRKRWWAEHNEAYGGNGKKSPYQNAAKAGREAASKKGATTSDIIGAQKEARKQTKINHIISREKGYPEVKAKREDRQRELNIVKPDKTIKRVKKATSGDISWEKKRTGFKKYGRDLKSSKGLKTEGDHGKADIDWRRGEREDHAKERMNDKRTLQSAIDRLNSNKDKRDSYRQGVTERHAKLENRARLAAFLANTKWDEMTDTQRRWWWAQMNGGGGGTATNPYTGEAPTVAESPWANDGTPVNPYAQLYGTEMSPAESAFWREVYGNANDPNWKPSADTERFGRTSSEDGLFSEEGWAAHQQLAADLNQRLYTDFNNIASTEALESSIDMLPSALDGFAGGFLRGMGNVGSAAVDYALGLGRMGLNMAINSSMLGKAISMLPGVKNSIDSFYYNAGETIKDTTGISYLQQQGDVSDLADAISGLSAMTGFIALDMAGGMGLDKLSKLGTYSQKLQKGGTIMQEVLKGLDKYGVKNIEKAATLRAAVDKFLGMHNDEMAKLGQIMERADATMLEKAIEASKQAMTRLATGFADDEARLQESLAKFKGKIRGEELTEAIGKLKAAKEAAATERDVSTFGKKITDKLNAMSIQARANVVERGGESAARFGAEMEKSASHTTFDGIMRKVQDVSARMTEARVNGTSIKVNGAEVVKEGQLTPKGKAMVDAIEEWTQRNLHNFETSQPIKRVEMSADNLIKQSMSEALKQTTKATPEGRFNAQMNLERAMSKMDDAIKKGGTYVDEISGKTLVKDGKATKTGESLYGRAEKWMDKYAVENAPKTTQTDWGITDISDNVLDSYRNGHKGNLGSGWTPEQGKSAAASAGTKLDDAARVADKGKIAAAGEQAPHATTGTPSVSAGSAKGEPQSYAQAYDKARGEVIKAYNIKPQGKDGRFTAEQWDWIDEKASKVVQERYPALHEQETVARQAAASQTFPPPNPTGPAPESVDTLEGAVKKIDEAVASKTNLRATVGPGEERLLVREGNITDEGHRIVEEAWRQEHGMATPTPQPTKVTPKPTPISETPMSKHLERAEETLAKARQDILRQMQKEGRTLDTAAMEELETRAKHLAEARRPGSVEEVRYAWEGANYEPKKQGAGSSELAEAIKTKWLPVVGAGTSGALIAGLGYLGAGRSEEGHGDYHVTTSTGKPQAAIVEGNTNEKIPLSERYINLGTPENPVWYDKKTGERTDFNPNVHPDKEPHEPDLPNNPAAAERAAAKTEAAQIMAERAAEQPPAPEPPPRPQRQIVEPTAEEIETAKKQAGQSHLTTANNLQAAIDRLGTERAGIEAKNYEVPVPEYRPTEYQNIQKVRAAAAAKKGATSTSIIAAVNKAQKQNADVSKLKADLKRARAGARTDKQREKAEQEILREYNREYFDAVELNETNAKLSAKRLQKIIDQLPRLEEARDKALERKSNAEERAVERVKREKQREADREYRDQLSQWRDSERARREQERNQRHETKDLARSIRQETKNVETKEKKAWRAAMSGDKTEFLRWMPDGDWDSAQKSVKSARRIATVSAGGWQANPALNIRKKASLAERGEKWQIEKIMVPSILYSQPVPRIEGMMVNRRPVLDAAIAALAV